MKRIASLALVITGLLAAPSSAAAQAQSYEVDGARTLRDRIAIGATGAAIVEADHGHVVVTATQTEVRKIRRLGFAVRTLRPPRQSAARRGHAGVPAGRLGLPRLRRDGRPSSTAVASTTRRSSRAVQPRHVATRAAQLWAVKISDNVGTDEDEPEVLFTASQHAREHLTVEMALYLLNELTDEYGTDSRITGLVDGREIWIVFDMNPDGGEYDIATGSYRSWRKNRQPNAARRARSAPT